MSFSNTTETAILAAIFNATPWANYLDNAASSPQTTIGVALHTADPGEAGTMATSEAAYTSYARQNVNRNSGGWTVSGNTVNPTAIIEFPAATGGSESLTHWSPGKNTGGSAAIIITGTLTPAVAISGAGTQPRLTTASSISLD